MAHLPGNRRPWSGETITTSTLAEEVRIGRACMCLCAFKLKPRAACYFEKLTYLSCTSCLRFIVLKNYFQHFNEICIWKFTSIFPCWCHTVMTKPKKWPHFCCPLSLSLCKTVKEWICNTKEAAVGKGRRSLSSLFQVENFPEGFPGKKR